MEDRLDPHLLLNEQAERLIAHAGRRAGAVWDIDSINAHRFQITSPFHFLGRVYAFRGNDLYHGDELAGRELLADLRAFLERHRRDRSRHSALGRD